MYENEYIKKNTALYIMRNNIGTYDAIEDAMEQIRKSKAEDVHPVVHGEWIEKPHWEPLAWDCEPSVSLNPDEYDRKTHSEKQMWWHCSCCDCSPSRWGKPLFNFCPNCGADMNMKEES